MSCKSGSSIEKYFDGAKWFVTNYISVEQLQVSANKLPSTQQMAKIKSSFLPRGCGNGEGCVPNDKYMGIYSGVRGLRIL
jgi:hypothetical protein